MLTMLRRGEYLKTSSGRMCNDSHGTRPCGREKKRQMKRWLRKVGKNLERKIEKENLTRVPNT